MQSFSFRQCLLLQSAPVLLLLFGAVSVRAQITIEAEDAVVNREVLLENKMSDHGWNLWSTDRDRFKKWSQGVVIQGPVVKQDRTASDEGAPVLHLALKDIPAGTYDLELKVTRVLGLSFDNENWQRCTGGVVRRNLSLGEKTFEFWIDDRYAMEKEGDRGSGYLDTITLYRCVPVENGVGNPGFEELTDGKVPAAWAWWSRDQKGQAISVENDKHEGNRAVHITYDSDKDWAYSCGTRLKVKQGMSLCLRAWIKGPSDQDNISLDAVGEYDGKRVTWHQGHASGKPNGDWQALKAYLTISDDVNSIYVRFVGNGRTDILVDEVSLREETFVLPVKPKVTGWARERVEEPMGRGVVALMHTDRKAYISWRLLKDDPQDIAFDVFRRLDDTPAEKINSVPIVQTTDMIDSPPEGTLPVYLVRPAAPFTGAEGEAVLVPCPEDGSPYAGIKLAEETTRVQKVGIADLNGDGVYDYVIKQPNANIDPWIKYWTKSPETYKLEGYLADGTFLWRIDLGWAVERGIWYSPYLVYDLTGDGKAEVAAKIGEGDPRDEDGRVTSGPEWLAVWNGMTGEEITRVPWPSREGFSNYNLASRNQIAVAYLDGKTPCLLALRGTYSRMKVDAYQLKDGQLQPLWQYDNEGLGGRYRGQGAHFTLAADVDSDGREEVILGSVVLDDTGAPLWTTGRGHPDAAYLTDVDPSVPGMEIAYVMETRQRQGGGLNLVKAATGELLWKLEPNTNHVHGKGLCADVDPLVPGMEVYGADADGHKLTENRWLFAADGTLLKSGTDCPWGFGISTVWWDADLQKEVSGSRISDFGGGQLADRIVGSIVTRADVLGDWREELITSVSGELRIYVSTIPAMDRRVCLMQDSVYRLGTCMNAMGYTQDPTLSYNLEAVSPNLNLTFVQDQDQPPCCQVVVSAPLSAGITGELVFRPSSGVRMEPASLEVNLQPGGRLVRRIAVQTDSEARLAGEIVAELRQKDTVLVGRTLICLAAGFLKNGCIVQAEAFTGESGGKVQIRTDKPGVQEKAISHWDDKDHTLTWNVAVPTAGEYELILRYSTPKAVHRELVLDAIPAVEIVLPGTGGFGSVPSEWDHAATAREGQNLRWELAAGNHVITLKNTDGNGCNLDYLALVAVTKK